MISQPYRFHKDSNKMILLKIFRILLTGYQKLTGMVADKPYTEPNKSSRWSQKNENDDLMTLRVNMATFQVIHRMWLEIYVWSHHYQIWHDLMGKFRTIQSSNGVFLLRYIEVKSSFRQAYIGSLAFIAVCNLIEKQSMYQFYCMTEKKAKMMEARCINIENQD